MTTTSLPFSKKLYDLLGDFETEKYYWCDTYGNNKDAFIIENHKPHNPQGGWICYPAPNFGELVRLFDKISAKKDIWRTGSVNHFVLELYQQAPTEQEGMQAVEEYFNKII